MATPIPFILLAINGKKELIEATARLANPALAPRAAKDVGDAMAARPSKDELDIKLRTLFRSLKKK